MHKWPNLIVFKTYMNGKLYVLRTANWGLATKKPERTLGTYKQTWLTRWGIKISLHSFVLRYLLQTFPVFLFSRLSYCRMLKFINQSKINCYSDYENYYYSWKLQVYLSMHNLEVNRKRWRDNHVKPMSSENSNKSKHCYEMVNHTMF